MAVANEGELAALTQQGLSRRTVASTCMNAGSSRSHCLITLTVQRHLPDGAVMHGKLTLVDLAGLKIEALPDTTIFWLQAAGLHNLADTYSDQAA